MTPAELIADLDRALERRGSPVQLRKTNTAAGQKTVMARYRGYRSDELVGIIKQGDTKVVVSPTGLETFGVPPQNGFVVINGIPRLIIVPTPIYDGGTLVRIDIQVRG